MVLANDRGTIDDYSGGTTVTGGSLLVVGDDRLPRNGAVTVAAGAALEFNAGTNHFLAGSTLAVAGDVIVSGGTVDFSSGTAITLPTFTLAAGQLAGSDTVTVTGLLNWTGGTMAGAGMTMIGGGGQMLIGGSNNKYGQSRPVCNGGTIIWDGTGGIWLGGGSSFDNEPGARFQAAGDAALVAADGTTPLFDNEGLFVKSSISSGVTTVGAGIGFHNGGTVEVDSGTLAFAGSSLDNFDPIGGRLAGGTFVVVGTLQLTGAGNFVTNDAALVLDGSGPAQILDENGNSGLVNLALNDVGGSLTLRNGYVLATGGGFTNLGYLLLDPTSALSVAGDFTQGSAATLEIQLGGVGLSGQVAIAGNANLGGTLTLTPVNGYVPTAGDAFTILTFAARNGSDFANPPAGFNEVFDDGNGNLTAVAQ